MFELTVKVRDEDSKYSRSFIIYENCYISQDDPHIKDCIEKTLDDFGKEPDSIKCKINFEVVQTPTLQVIDGSSS